MQWVNILKVLKGKKNLTIENTIFGKTVLQKLQTNEDILR